MAHSRRAQTLRPRLGPSDSLGLATAMRGAGSLALPIASLLLWLRLRRSPRLVARWIFLAFGARIFLRLWRAAAGVLRSGKTAARRRAAARNLRLCNRRAVADAATRQLSASQQRALDLLRSNTGGSVRTVAAITAGDVSSADAVSALTQAAARQSVGDGAVACEAYMAGALCPPGRNAVTALNPSATQEAREKDRARQSKPRSALPPLHGVPVSIKECIQQRGMCSTIGLAKRAELPAAADDAVLVKVLRAAGAVPFCQSNIPQTMLSFECSNPVFGQTRNPHRAQLGPGGSSGGEGCLLASGASLLGIGTDIGGSVRIPAHFCGVCGFKPTKHRVSAIGTVPSMPGQLAVAGTPGPMARDVDGLILLMRALAGTRAPAAAGDGDAPEGDTAAPPLMHVLDPTIPPLGFREHLLEPPVGSNGAPRPLRVGVVRTDGMFAPTPACLAAVDAAAEALSRAGHEVEAFDELAVAHETGSARRSQGHHGEDFGPGCAPHNAIGPRAFSLFASLIGGDEGATLLHDGAHSAKAPDTPGPCLGLKDEDVDPVLQQMANLMAMPKWLRAPLSRVCGAIGWSRMALLLSQTGRNSAERMHALAARAQALRLRVSRAMERRNLDVLLTPAMVIPPCASGAGAANPTACNYTAIWNLLDFPAGVLPVCVATEDDMGEKLREWRRDEGRGAVGGLGLPSDPWGAKVGKAAGDAAGMPIGVQVVAPPWQDEACLGAMRTLETALGAAVRPTHTD